MKKTFKRDWRRSKDYEELKTYSLEKWAWEFLRRNPDYCREYRELTEGLTEIQTLQAAFNPGCRKWDLLTWLNPDRGYSNIPFIPPGGAEAVISSLDFPKGKGTVFYFAGKHTGEVFFRFDTRKPINPQIEAAKKKLLELQRDQSGERQAIFKPRAKKKIEGGSREEEWINLLRVLDATAEGRKPKEIVKVFYPDKKIISWRDSEEFYLEGDIALDRAERIKEVGKKIKQAKRYASHDYRLISFR